MENEILALPAECWRWHPGHVGIMQVSTRGQVKTVDRWVIGRDGRKQFIKGRILKPHRNELGYLKVGLRINGKKRNFSVHRLVAETWLDNPENKPEVNHLDENPGNPDVFNLSWASRIENVRWGTGIERQAASHSKAVEAIDPSTGEVVKEFPSTREAGRNGFNQGDLAACCRGEKRIHKGYIWRYKT